MEDLAEWVGEDCFELRKHNVFGRRRSKHVYRPHASNRFLQPDVFSRLAKLSPSKTFLEAAGCDGLK
jgi:hypothetical protein